VVVDVDVPVADSRDYIPGTWIVRQEKRVGELSG